MGICIICGGITRSRVKKCRKCKTSISSKKYLTPEVTLSDKEKEQLEELKMMYDPKSFYDKLFKTADDEIITR